MADDAELLQRWRDGDASAGNQLFQRCFAPIYRFFVNKTRSLADTEELTQNTFVALASARDQLPGPSSILTYALGVANNLLADHYRGLGNAAPIDPLTRPIAALGASARTQLECRDSQELLIIALREIALELQIVLELYYVEELDPARIAEALGVPVATVRGRIQRGCDQLRDKVEELAGRTTITPAVEDRWAQLIKGAFPARVLSTAFVRED